MLEKEKRREEAVHGVRRRELSEIDGVANRDHLDLVGNLSSRVNNP